MKNMRVFLVLALLVVLSMNAFGWGNATHVYIAQRLGTETGRVNPRALYGATLNDAFNLILTPTGQYLYDQLHHNPMPFLGCAYRCQIKAVAYGFASHNGLWGADYTAHDYMLPGKKDTGYAVLMGQAMTEAVAPKILAVLENSGIVPDPQKYPDPATDPVIQFAYGIAPELGHDLSETAVDILLKEKLEAAGAPIGLMMMDAAQTRPVDVPAVLVAAYGLRTAKATHTPLVQVVKLIVDGEKAWKETIAQYGGLFTYDRATIIAQLAEANAAVAGQYLSYYFKLFTGADVPFEVKVADAQSFIETAILTVQSSWEAELEKTIGFTARELKKHNVQSCGSADFFGKEDADAPVATVASDCFSLDGNYPNPFNPTTTIAFHLPADAPVSIEIYNILGQKVRTLLDHVAYGSGAWSVVWDGRNDAGSLLPSGAYLCRLSSPAGTMTRKMTMAK